MRISQASSRRLARAFSVAALALAAQAHASVSSSLPDDFFHVSGDVRLYDFSKDYGSRNETDQHSSAIGGKLKVTTSPFLGGFGVGASLYHASSLETFDHQETTLMGAKKSLTVVGEAYAQFAGDHGLLIRAGRQEIDTPWMGPRDSRMIPQTFRGIWAQISPVKGLQLMVTRVDQYKSRDSSGFYRDNLYYPKGFDGDDALYGTTKTFPKKAAPKDAKGTFAAGAKYASGGAHVQAWLYDFYGFAKTVFLDGGYTFGNASQALRPYLDAQYMRQTGGDILVDNKATLFGLGGKVDSTLWGARGGLKFDGNDVSLSYDKLEDHAGAYGGGALVVPYGDFTAMYAQVMANNLLKFGPGQATKLAWSRGFFGKKVKLTAALMRFRTSYGGNSYTEYLDASYAFDGSLKGLSLRDRLAIANGVAGNDNRALIYNRVMMQYRF